MGVQGWGQLEEQGSAQLEEQGSGRLEEQGSGNWGDGAWHPAGVSGALELQQQ